MRPRFTFAVAALALIAACRDVTAPATPGFALAYVRHVFVATPGVDSIVLAVTSPDMTNQFAAYRLPFRSFNTELSPDGQQILLGQSDGSIWVEPVTTAVAAQILAPKYPAGAWYADWSPDGAHIVYYNPDGGGRAWVANADGGNPHPVAADSGVYKPQFDPSWSPDGRQIAFDGPYRGTVWHTYVMNEDGTNAREVSLSGLDTTAEVYSPAWSPDSRQLAVDRTVGDSVAIWITNVDGSGARQITKQLFEPWGRASWSPDGSKMVFAAQDQWGHVFEVDVSTGTVTRLTTSLHEDDLSAQWVRWPVR
jgi:TolB protein